MAVATAMPASTWRAPEPIGAFQMLSLANGHLYLFRRPFERSGVAG